MAMRWRMTTEIPISWAVVSCTDCASVDSSAGSTAMTVTSGSRPTGTPAEPGARADRRSGAGWPAATGVGSPRRRRGSPPTRTARWSRPSEAGRSRLAVRPTPSAGRSPPRSADPRRPAAGWTRPGSWPGTDRRPAPATPPVRISAGGRRRSFGWCPPSCRGAGPDRRDRPGLRPAWGRRLRPGLDEPVAGGADRGSGVDQGLFEPPQHRFVFTRPDRPELLGVGTQPVGAVELGPERRGELLDDPGLTLEGGLQGRQLLDLTADHGHPGASILTGTAAMFPATGPRIKGRRVPPAARKDQGGCPVGRRATPAGQAPGANRRRSRR